MTTCDLTRNPKQQVYFNEVINASLGKSANRYLFIGGAVRGGKTVVEIASLGALCKMFPGSRWHIMRDSFTNLELTTIPSLSKILPEYSTEGIRKYSRSPGNWYVEFYNGSKIILVSEGIHHDPELGWMDGIETNGICLEQMEGLSRKTFNKSIERAGSWIIDPMPMPLVLGTFNPTQRYIKELIYEPWVKGDLKSPYYFVEALPTDNPFNTEEQWKSWENLDEISYKTRIEADWYAYSMKNLFIYTFSEHKNVAQVEVEPGQIHLSFDFNVNPMTCLVCQHNYTTKQIKILDEIRLENSTIYDMCNRIKGEYNVAQLKITGDPRGTARHSLAKSAALNHYAVMVQELGINQKQIELPRNFPSPTEEHDILRLVANSVLSRYPQCYIDPKCKYLLQDIRFISTVKGRREKQKEGMNGHLLDCLLYYLFTYFFDFVHKN